ncbi:putative UPF0481 protein At3g02645 [Mangifera indica]|uniref:putative UPF0481 protein At3g02645 n=1 Tax=Mangifera indica TaxID=29780 RepID=UPI001CF942D8|nr:putative UPF0481 protein At3g02645 [Mangifera indica]
MAHPVRSISSFVYPHAQLIDEKQWLSVVRSSIEQERSKSNSKVSIFVVPKTLMYMAPNCYTPQHVALGPNHYWRPELHDMEGYKIAAAKSVQQQLRYQSLEFKDLVQKFKGEFVPDLQAYYQRFIRLGDEILAWVMAVDTAFLLEFLQVTFYAVEENKKSKIPLVTSVGGEILSAEDDVVHKKAYALSLMSQMRDYAGSLASRNAILRDVIMLENQIPLFLLREMLTVQFSTTEESANNILFPMLKAFCKEVCPFKFMVDSSTKIEVSKSAHLLHYMYQMVLNVEKLSPPENKTKTEEEDDKHKENSLSASDNIVTLLSKVKSLLSNLKLPKKLKPIAKATALVVKIPWHWIYKQKDDDSLGDNDDSNKAAEIEIPSATKLEKAGISFSAVRRGKFPDIIFFDSKRARFKLPTITLDENTEVVLRNLVAYEASNPSHSLYFTRYTELMNGIIDTAEDVKLLKRRGIIQNGLKSDEEAVKLWNGMSRSIRSTKVRELDDLIKEVNRYYNRGWLIKAKKYVENYVYESWQFLTLLAAILLLLLEMFQAVCSVYNCNTIFHFENPAE